jgi:hypothetical protein
MWLVSALGKPPIPDIQLFRTSFRKYIPLLPFPYDKKTEPERERS